VPGALEAVANLVSELVAWIELDFAESIIPRDPGPLSKLKKHSLIDPLRDVDGVSTTSESNIDQAVGLAGSNAK
jgi:hypothetical protein